MSDFGIPTANYTPPDGLQTLGNLMSLKQKQQGLQQQQLEMAGQTSRNQSLAANAENDTAIMGERQRVSAMMSSGKDDQGNSILGADGQPDPSKALAALGRIAPRTGQAYAQSILQTEKDKVGLQAASASLESQERNMLSGVAGAQVGNPNATSASFAKDLAPLIQAHPEMAPAATYALNLAKHIDTMQDPKKRDEAWQHLQALHMSPDQVSAQSMPHVADQDNGANILSGTTAAPLAGGGFTAQTQTGKKLPPQVVAGPGGVPSVWGGATGQGQSLAKGPKASGPAPTDQDMARHNIYETNLNNRVQIGTDAQTVIRETEAAVNAIKTGAGSSTRASIAKTLQSLGAPQGLVDAVSGGNLGATQEAEKMLFQQTLMGLRQSMQGDPAHVAEFNEANAVFPNIDTDPRAKQKIMNFIANKADRDYAEQQALNKAKMDGTFNPATWQAEYQKNLRAGKVSGTPESQIPKGPAGAKTIVRTGTLNGRKVAEYSDGTHGYIQ